MSLLAAAAEPGSTEQAGVAVDTAGAATLTENAKTMLNADDSQTALATAEAAVAAGGGADAFVARAEAKRALGRPLAEVIDDYAQAARLNPRYAEKYQGLIAQLQSTARPETQNSAQTGAGGVAMPFVGGLALAGLVLLAISILYLRRKKSVGKSASEL